MSSAPAERACPRCTLIQRHTNATCEICEAPLPKLHAPAPPEKKRKPQPTTGGTVKQISPSDFFRPAKKAAAAAAAPSIPVARGSAETPAPTMMKGPIDAATLPSTPSELTDSLTAYKPQHAGWSPGAPVPYALVAAALDAVSATRSRLTKELVLTNAMRSVLALGSQAADIEAVAFLLSPAKDAQSGGHRLRPDWHPDNKPLGITHGAINAAISRSDGCEPLPAVGSLRQGARQRRRGRHRA